MSLTDILQITGTKNISIPDTWFYGVINTGLLAVVIWGINRWIGKMDTKMDKVDATFQSVNNTLLLHGQMHEAHAKMFENFIARFEKIEERLERRKP